MLPCTPRSVTRKLRSSPLQHVQYPRPAPPLPFLYPRWFTGLSNVGQHATTSPEPSIPETEVSGALDLSQLHERSSVRLLSQNPKKNSVNISALKAIVKQRTDRLPRAQLKVRSELEQGLLNRILSSPSFRTARRDVETMYDEISEEDSARKHAQLARMREVYKPGRIDWVQHAAKLVVMKPTTTRPGGKELELREEFIKYYAGNSRSNMWFQRVGSGSEVHLLPEPGSRDGLRRIRLHGSARALELGAKHLLRLQDLHHLSGHISGINQHHGLGFQKQTTVSVRTFSRYISRLVKQKIPRSIQQETGETFNEQTAAALVRVFLDPTVSKYASTVALQIALKFVCRHTELEATAHTLHEQAKRLGLQLDTIIFNQLLKLAIARNNDEKTTSLIDEMRQSGVLPNNQTWLLFFAAVPSNDGRRAIMSLMKRAGVRLDEAAQIELAKLLAEGRLRTMEDSLDEFWKMLNDLDSIFGAGWLTTSVYHGMIRACNRRYMSKIPAMLLKLPSQRKIQATRVTETLLLAQNRRLVNIDESVKVLSSILRKNGQEVNDLDIAFAFMTAWDRRRLNLCRVLWRHAASHGSIFATMQFVVTRSLLCNTSKSDYNSDKWNRYASSIIAGTDLDMTGFETIFPRLSKRCSGLANPMEWLALYTPDDGTRDEQISLAYVMLNRDLNAWKRCRPMTKETLHSLLKRAEQMDLQEKQEKWFSNNLPVGQLLQKAISVPLEPREFSLHADLTSPTDEFPTDCGV